MPLPDERLKIWLDLLKWAVASVGIVIATLIIDSGFKDREIGIKELSLYNDHVDLVTNSENVAQRRLLAQYFAYVTPSDKLRERWQAYFEIVDREYQDLKLRLESRKAELDSIVKIDTVYIHPEEVEHLKEEIFRFEQELSPKFEKDKEKEQPILPPDTEREER
jgi:hypothetical protein